VTPAWVQSDSATARQARLIVAWTPATLCALWAGYRALGIAGDYPLVPLLTYTPYVLPVGIAAAVVAGLLREWLAMGLALVAAFLIFLAIAPRVLGGEYEGSGKDGVRVMAANVLEEGANAEQLLELVRERRVDVLAVQELTPEFAAELEALGIRRDLPHAHLLPEPGATGSGIYARHPVDPVTRGGFDFKQARAEVRVRRDLRLDVTSVHLDPPTSRDSVDPWRDGLDVLPDPDERRVQLLLGDFNGTLDNPELRELINTGYVDAAEDVGKGLIPTWPATDKPFRFLPVAIDHVLFEDGFAVRRFEVLDVEGTDHRPVYADLVAPTSSD
jgi:endonuclease/exonuclease/phosphatase (EEP) superfamily protein YafD